MRTSARGQIVVEYFILFAAVALVTMIGLTRFDDDVKAALANFFQTAADKVTSEAPGG